MVNVPFSFGSHNAYREPKLSLTSAPRTLNIDLREGEHVYTSPDPELGTIHAMKASHRAPRLPLHP
ncbi:hypothetical protein AURDEDRAFT_115163 [Auricularia subglabra TFB-10046 SS5]|nr:hypothetical protein AURDEDRAFT_115163 [Auricularia subglabra TFB-10046 SS5]